MAFYEDVLFPEGISFNARGGPTFDTNVVVTGGRLEYRNQTSAYQVQSYEVSFDARLKSVFDRIPPIFYVARGRLHGFRLHDARDCLHNDNGGTGAIVMIDSTHFQLVKRYTAGATSVDRYIKKLRSGVTLTGGGSYTLDTTTGIVTKVSGAAPTAWAGSFDVPVRFDTDTAPWEIINRSGTQFVMAWQSITLVELLNP